ncbi:hypothetical protein KI387_038452, partial [Taxus chinensis]
MGSLCCVAARPHGSQRGCADWSVGPNESRCRTNRSFSPPLSRRWDYRFHSEAVSSGSHGLPFYESSLSSTSKGSRSRISSSGHILNHQYSASDGSFSNFNSPSDSFHAQQWDTMGQGINLGEFVSANMSGFPYALNIDDLDKGWCNKEGLNVGNSIHILVKIEHRCSALAAPFGFRSLQNLDSPLEVIASPVAQISFFFNLGAQQIP